MNIYVMDSSLTKIGVIDSYRSMIWTKRYYEPGDFELVLEATEDNIELCQCGRLLYRDMDYENGAVTSVMIIQYIQLDTSLEEGNTLLLQGKDIKSLVWQRVVWNQTVLSGSLEANIRTIITNNIVSPTISARRINNFVLGSEMGGTPTVKVQVTGDNVGEWVVEQLTPYGIGYDVRVSGGDFVFTLYQGADRSYDQDTNAVVVFSPSYENLITSTYVYSITDQKNVALVAGEGEGGTRKTAVAGDNTLSGIDRVELFVDARDLTTETESGTLTNAEYLEQLTTRGVEALTEYPLSCVYEGEIEADINFVYGTDFFLGDKVQVINEFGIGMSARIVEIIYSEDETGRKVIPTFSAGGE